MTVKVQLGKHVLVTISVFLLMSWVQTCCGSLWSSHLLWEGSGDSEDGDVEDDTISMSGDSSLVEEIEVSETTPLLDESGEPKTGQNYNGTGLGSTNRGVVDIFLSRVEDYDKNKDTCEPGVKYNLGDGVITQYGVNRFKAQAMAAVSRANFLTRLWKGLPKSYMETEYFVYTQVRSIVESDDDIFAAGNCYDEHQYRNYTLFCPYAFRSTNDSSLITVKNLATYYPYLGNDSEFFMIPRIKAERKLSGHNDTSKGLAIYSDNITIIEDSILSTYEDGHWSRPYFDCLGGDIWMMTYTVPFFGYHQHNNSYHFKGTSGIDIDLQKVDIDQCPPSPGSTGVNVFAGSAKCKNTTKCVPVPTLGFRRGSYKCECKKGYYFPITDPSAPKYFNGSEIEIQYEKKMNGQPNDYDEEYECEQCAVGCDTCVDNSPCILALYWLQRGIVLSMACVIICFIPLLMCFTFKYRDVKVLKAASPMLLRVILIGALFLYCPMIVNYFEPTEITCSLRIWLREIGFSISYGALLLKTWRISVVFRVRSAQRIKISDTDLMKRLVLIVLCFAAYLSVRMVVNRPRVERVLTAGTHSSDLYAHQCSWDVWDYCAAIAELCLLLWGIRLCIVVRKAPSEFNESRFISWAIYNETLLSLFLNITMFFLQEPANPDLLYLVLFIHTQLTTTVTLAFLFCSKAYLVYKYRDKEQPPTTMRGGSKYVAAPTKTSTTHLTMNSHTHSSTDKFCDGDLECHSNSLEKDIQDEFKRLYMQLELLKQKNMKLGNPHLGRKLSVMTEAAKREESSETPPPSPNLNGKRVVINLDDFKDSTSL